MMEKQKFQEYPPEERLRMLDDNCDNVVENYQFTKYLTPEEMDTYRENFADSCIAIYGIEQEVKDFAELKKAEMKPLKEIVSSLREAIKRKAVDTIGTAFMYPDYKTNEMGYYDSLGDLISTRRLRPEEKQLNIHSMRKTS